MGRGAAASGATVGPVPLDGGLHGFVEQCRIERPEGSPKGGRPVDHEGVGPLVGKVSIATNRVSTPSSLIADAYNDLADAVCSVTAVEGRVRNRLRDGLPACRRWCVDNAQRFLLIFGTPIPGHSAPGGGPTAQANRRIGEAFFSVVVEGCANGELLLPEGSRVPEPAEEAFTAAMAPGFPAEWMGAFISAWTHFHGMVTLEILNQLDWIYPDAASLHRAEIDHLLDGWR